MSEAWAPVSTRVNRVSASERSVPSVQTYAPIRFLTLRAPFTTPTATAAPNNAAVPR